jgi:predicted  nucleic acid-binding Zn-ribbon protein
MLHDVDHLLRESHEEEKGLGFEFKDVKDSKVELEKAREKITQQLDKPVLDRYEVLLKRYGRAVAPVANGTCYGCYMGLHTAMATGKDKNEQLTPCPNCGRFLYWIEK